VSSFRSIVIGCSFLFAGLVGIWILADDSLLQITSNYHWYVVLVFCIVDSILGMQVLLTSALGQWDEITVRAAALWSVLVIGAVIWDVLLELQLPSNYPAVTIWQSFQYLFLGLNGNPLPLAVPILVTLHSMAALIGLLPRRTPWFHFNSLPTRKTITVMVLIAVVIMGMRPTYAFLTSSGLLPATVSPPGNTVGIEPLPLRRSSLPYALLNRTAFICLVAVADPMLPYNFNDTNFGHMIIYVPANWTIRLYFQNREGFPHSAVLLSANTPKPTIIDPSSNIIAQIPNDAVNGGFLLNGESGSVTIHDLAPGKYWIACAFDYPVPHVMEGMWVVLIVTNQANTPYCEILQS